jgi:hypothetical protein
MTIRVALRDVQRHRRHVDGDHPRARQFMRERHRQAAAAGADVDDDGGFAEAATRRRRRPGGAAIERERFFDDQFGFGARNEHIAGDLELEAPELAVADDVGDWFTLGTPLDQRAEVLSEAVFAGGGQRIALTRDHLLARPPEHMTREDVGVDGRVRCGDAGRGEPRLGLAETIVKSAGRHAVRRAEDAGATLVVARC